MHVLLGISGSIAAYKTPELIRQLKKVGISVTPILTDHARQFVTPLSLETVAETRLPEDGILHLELGRSVEGIILAPATANLIAKLAAGIADDLLTTTVLSFTGPKIVVPAMHHEMWINPITQRNIATLKSFGFQILGPDSGALACGDLGEGRMVDLGLIVLSAQLLAFPALGLSEKRVLITSGGTREPLDSVRILTNLSTGQLGETLAHCAAILGAEVTLISTLPTLSNPGFRKFIPVDAVAQLETALISEFPTCDALIMAAAVSDFTVQKSDHKLSREGTQTLSLTATPDLLRELSSQKTHQQTIGFCLTDPEHLLTTARQKLRDKHLDAIVANPPAAIGASRRDATLITDQGLEKTLRQVDLVTMAYEILSLIH